MIFKDTSQGVAVKTCRGENLPRLGLMQFCGVGMPNGESGAFILALVVMLVGLFGLVIPLFPGIVVIWLGALGYGLMAGFGTWGTILFILITLLAIFGSLIDNVLMGAGARRGGASWKAILAAFLAGVLGTLLFPPLGGLLASLLAVLLVEYARLQDWNKVWAAVRGLAAGWGLSFVVAFLTGLVMIALWLVWTLIGS